MRRDPSADGSTDRRTFLFLQGHASPLFAQTADRLEERGHRCLRINFNVGDWIFWRRPGATSYRGRLSALPAFVERFIDDEGVTDLVLLGEERPVHRPAVAAAARRGLPVYAVDMGYFRPDWLTVERGGSGCNSHFPADPATIRAAAAVLPEPDFTPLYGHSFFAESVFDLLYNLPNVFAWFVFPHYRWHALDHPLAEYAGWLIRLGRTRRRASEALQIERQMTDGRTRFFLFPLQLETDFQIRAHSPFRNLLQAVEMVLHSFAKHAPAGTELLFKLHPLDNGLRPWPKIIARAAARHGLSDRVHFIDGGALDGLIAASSGVVTVNSTVGLHAIRAGRPVKTLGIAIYDIDGLTDRRPLADFWPAPTLPDAALCGDFVRLVANALQFRGDVFDRAGIEAAATSLAARIATRSVNAPGAFVAVPPRSRPQKVP